MKFRIDTLTPQELERYRQRSSNAINGIQYLLQNLNDIVQHENIIEKYKVISNYIGLYQEDENSFYNYFVPLNADIVFLLSVTALKKLENNNHEQLGIPNRRYTIYFSEDVFEDEKTVISFLNSLKGIFENG